MICRDCGCVIDRNGKHTREWKKSWVLDGRRVHSRLYCVWETMKTRCTNPNHDSYRFYGARGIRVCREWQKSDPFIIWSLDNGYQPGYVIDRMDSSKNYSPSNCRWIHYIDNQPNLKLTPDDVLAIRAAEGTQTEIGKRFDIHPSYVGRLKRLEHRLDVPVTLDGSPEPMGITDPNELCEECDRPMNGADGLFCADCQDDS